MAGPIYLLLLQDQHGNYIHLWGPLGGYEPQATTGGMQIPLMYAGLEPQATAMGLILESEASAIVTEPVAAGNAPQYESVGVQAPYETSGRLIWV